MNYIHSHIPIQGPKCYIPLESVYYLFVTYCHEFCNKESQICRWICSYHCWKRTLKVSYLIREWWKRASRIYFVYQVVHYHRHWDFEEYAQTYHEAFNQTLFVQNYRGVYPSTFYSLEVYDTQVAVTCLKIRETLKCLISDFKTSVSLLPYNLVYPTIVSTMYHQRMIQEVWEESLYPITY